MLSKSREGIPKFQSVANIKLPIVNPMGSLVRTLIDQHKQQGIHTIYWDGTLDNGKKVCSWIYSVYLEAGGYSVMKKLVLAR